MSRFGPQLTPHGTAFSYAYMPKVDGRLDAAGVGGDGGGFLYLSTRADNPRTAARNGNFKMDELGIFLAKLAGPACASPS